MSFKKAVSVGMVFMLVSFLLTEGNAQTLPSGERLKNIVITTQVGVRTDQDGLFGSISQPFTTVFDREFNSATVTCYPAWEAWTGYKQYNLSNINDRINYSYSRGQTVMMHLLVGPDMYMPDWFKNGSYSNAELEDMLHDWIKTIIQSNSNNTKVDVWNVVNEAISFYPPYEYGVSKFEQLGFESDVSGLSGSQYVVSSHPVYIRKAFEYARMYTNAKLELRDSAAEFPTDPNHIKYDIFYQLTKHLVNKGVPIDAVGFQLHIDLNKYHNWENFKNNINRYRALGLETYITELDAGDTEENWNSTKAEQQRVKYYDAVRIAMETGCEYIHIWGLVDGLDQGWRANEHPLIFDEYYNPKPAYYGVQEALYIGQSSGDNSITIRAMGTTGSEQMQLQINDTAVKTWTITTSMLNYVYNTSESLANIKVALINDDGPRDIQVDYIQANGVTYQAEDQATNTGVWQGQCGGSYSEMLHCGGYIDFGTVQLGLVQAPYGGTPSAIPGLIQSEDYDIGGEGIAYHDIDSGNSGGGYRSDDVDIETTSDTGGGFNVGWIHNGEWLEYTVDVQSAGQYDFNIRVAALNSVGTLHIEFDGNDVTGPVSVPITGAWQTFTSVFVNNVSLSAGEQVMRVAMDSGAFNVNWINITESNNPPSVNITLPSNGATFTEGDNVTITANASDGDGSVSKVEFFRGSTKIGEDTLSPYSITWSNVPEGSYTLTAKATDNDGASTTSSGVNITVNEAPSSNNLITNGDFENGTSNWTGSGCTLSISTDAHSGTNSALATSRTASWAGPLQNFTSALLSYGQGDYDVSAWMKMASGSAQGSVTIRLVSGAGTKYILVRGNVTTSWTEITGPVSLTWSGTLTSAEVYIETPLGQTTSFKVDDIRITPAMLVNGDFENGTTGWVGTSCTMTSTTNAHSGSAAVYVTNRADYWAGPRQNITSVLASHGQGTYTLACWMRMASGSATGAITLKLVSGSGTNYVNVQDPVSTSWSQVAEQLNITWSGTLTTAELYLETPGSGSGNFYADDCTIIPTLAKRVVEEEEIIENAAVLPEKFTLRQNYPNPFNPSTNIMYEITEPIHVKIEVFNLKGQRVAVLVNELQNPGQHKTVFQAENLESGVFICRMHAGAFTQTRKMTFLK